jgi:DNA-binding NtrC family response regulator
VAATNRDLLGEVLGGRFREDLYYRLNVIAITAPPLRARREDIPLLVLHILKACGGDMTVAEETMQGLVAHDWPGNVRELRNVLERTMYLARATGQTELDLVSLPSAGPTPGDVFQFEPGKSYRETRAKFDAEFERRYVKWLLGRHGGNVSAAARDAKMDRKHLHDMAKKHGLRGQEHDDE